MNLKEEIEKKFPPEIYYGSVWQEAIIIFELVAKDYALERVKEFRERSIQLIDDSMIRSAKSKYIECTKTPIEFILGIRSLPLIEEEEIPEETKPQNPGVV